jgi:hypothetical protein
MPKNVDKVALGLALALLGYLGYSVMDTGAALVSQGKEPPGITQKMLRPELVAAQNHASPAGRDPFEVAWASYLSGNKAAAPADRGHDSGAPEDKGPTQENAGTAAQAGGANPKAAQEPEPPPPPEPPPLPSRLSSVCIGAAARMAVIDERVYRPGDVVKGATPAAGWLVESIENDCVVLRWGNVQQTLRIPRPGAAEHAEKKADGKP